MPNSSDWLRKFGLSDKPPLSINKKTPPSALVLEPKDEELLRLRQENRQLQVHLGHQAYKLLVKLAEENHGIEILNNSAAK